MQSVTRLVRSLETIADQAVPLAQSVKGRAPLRLIQVLSLALQVQAGQAQADQDQETTVLLEVDQAQAQEGHLTRLQQNHYRHQLSGHLDLYLNMGHRSIRIMALHRMLEW
jgi:hypothetical protein